MYRFVFRFQQLEGNTTEYNNPKTNLESINLDHTLRKHLPLFSKTCYVWISYKINVNDKNGVWRRRRIHGRKPNSCVKDFDDARLNANDSKTRIALNSSNLRNTRSINHYILVFFFYTANRMAFLRNSIEIRILMDFHESNARSAFGNLRWIYSAGFVIRRRLHRKVIQKI